MKRVNTIVVKSITWLVWHPVLAAAAVIIFPGILAVVAVMIGSPKELSDDDAITSGIVIALVIEIICIMLIVESFGA